MKILYLCPDLGIPVLGHKGGSIHVRSLIAALRRMGHSIVLAAPLLNGQHSPEPAAVDATLLHLPPSADGVGAPRALEAFNERLGVANSLPGEFRKILYDQDLATQLRYRFEPDPPDFIYERASLYTTAGVSLARELNRPLLIELNAPLALEHSVYRTAELRELAAAAEGWVLSRADAVLAVSAPVRDHALSLGVEWGRIHVIPNGVETSLFRPGRQDPAVRARWGLDDGPVLGFVGGMRPWHGVETLPALLERLVEVRPNVSLVLTGDGPLRRDLERDVWERGLSRSVVFTGPLPQPEVAELIRHFDVALAPYPLPEHDFYFSPLKLFEYMGCGTPVVAAGLGQIAEVVRDGETGLLYPPGDLDALTARCDLLLSDPTLRRRLGRAAAEEVHARYTWDHNAARVAELARALVAARAAAT